MAASSTVNKPRRRARDDSSPSQQAKLPSGGSSTVPKAATVASDTATIGPAARAIGTGPGTGDEARSAAVRVLASWPRSGRGNGWWWKGKLSEAAALEKNDTVARRSSCSNIPTARSRTPGGTMAGSPTSRAYDSSVAVAAASSSLNDRASHTSTASSAASAVAPGPPATIRATPASRSEASTGR